MATQTAKPTVVIPENVENVKVNVELTPNRGNALFKANFQKVVGKSWHKATISQKQDYTAKKVLAIYDKLHNQPPKEKKMGINPFVASDFSLAEEEFEALPHDWFRGFYIYLKSGGYAGNLGMRLTPYERTIYQDGNMVQAWVRYPVGKHPRKGIFGWGGTRKGRRNRRNRKTKRNN